MYLKNKDKKDSIKIKSTPLDNKYEAAPDYRKRIKSNGLKRFERQDNSV